MELTIREISEQLNSRVLDVCKELLPGGKVENDSEYRCASLDGGSGHSMSVHLKGEKAGVWSEFNGGVGGGDLLDLYCAVKDCKVFDAVKWAKGFLGIKDDTHGIHKKSVPHPPAVPYPNCRPVQKLLPWFESRGIHKETLDKYMVQEVDRYYPDRGVVTFAVFPYHSATKPDKVQFIKYRAGADKRSMHTSKDSEPCLFGWQAMPKDSKDQRTLIITEGEMDALAFCEAGFWAVSIPQGASLDGSRQTWIDNDWEQLQSFDEIVLAFDMDESGRATYKYAADRLGLHRCATIDFSRCDCKDANEVLQKCGQTGLTLAVNNDVVYPKPDELKSPFDEYQKGMVALLLNPEAKEALKGDTMPWGDLNNEGAGFRLRKGELTVWCGINGHGKSTLLNYVMVDSVVSKKRRWCIASFEYRPMVLYINVNRTFLGEYPCGSKTEEGWLEKFWQNTLFYVPEKDVKLDRLLDAFEYAFRRYGVEHFIVDSLTKLGFAEDDYNSQKKAADMFAEFSRRLGVQVHLVAHVRKGQDESRIPEKFDLKGTGTIADEADNIVIVWRNKEKEAAVKSGDHSKDSAPDAVMRICKQRATGWEGDISLCFHPVSTQYTKITTPSLLPIRFNEKMEEMENDTPVLF